MSGKYDDIIHLPRPVSRRHAPMTMIDRAAQFSPFAALTGYDAAIQETGRLTDGYVTLDESEKETLNQRLQLIRESLEDQPEVTITYFRPDERKAGGAYVHITGTPKTVDAICQAVFMADGTAIPFACIYSITGELFRDPE